MSRLLHLLFVSASLFGYSFSVQVEFDGCTLSEELQREIESYSPLVDRIINETTHGEFKSATYNYLADFIDKFGSRIAGSQNLENAIDYMLEKSENLSLENVHGEEVQVPHWIRGNESALLIKPRVKNLRMLGLGSSIGTPEDGIEAEAIVVRSFDDLPKLGRAKITGKIVVYDQKWISYGKSVIYRSHGASSAAKYGAVAVLIRSVTPFSLDNPHTGWQDYVEGVPKIPAACITVEDARMLRRMQKRGEKIVIRIKMDAENLPDATSRNTIAEIVGREQPQKVVVVSGHLDSWDVGQGAMDDGGGAFLSWSSLVLLKKLGLRPRRTVRSILWTAEEEGLVGAFAYVQRHIKDVNNMNFVMESDEGTFNPLGLSYSGSNQAGCILKKILSLTEAINTTRLVTPNGGPDISLWIEKGVPGASLLNENEQYFWYHHSGADTMDVEHPASLDKATALWAATAYIAADLSVDMPRT